MTDTPCENFEINIEETPENVTLNIVQDNDEVEIEISSIGTKGDKGPMGDTGIQGDTGIKGDTGTHGDTGVIGATGIQGIPGTTVGKGDTGESRGYWYSRRYRNSR